MSLSDHRNKMKARPSLLTRLAVILVGAGIGSLVLLGKRAGKRASVTSEIPIVEGKCSTRPPKNAQTTYKIQDSDYKSQSEEDKKLMQWFGNLCEGSYIEMCALDGIQYSNSHVFNKALQWKGVLI